ncbi:Uma2 family endonuclease [Rhodothermus marinus]|uniref:Uma2 family endonuclease n=1 Tax=Rhodothermus marinus TaxID=29549 RepID=UPI0012BA4EE9|nr:Uma2 family endonuclease [Rhodothermus marinus]BBM69804.1 restriction endonuclease [Rhodothermus marinus]
MATAEQHGHRLAPVAELFPPQGQWTEADYFALPETNRYVELSEGCLIMPPHPTYTHQSVLQRLFLRLQAFVEAHGLGIVRFAPLPVRLWPGKIREPDLFFIDRAHADRIGEQVCGVPDLVAEVLSPGTREVDRGEKFFEYARAGVREYWIVDPESRAIEVYVLRGHVYEPLGKFGPEETARSALLPGFEVPVNDIFAEINPKGQ